MWKVEVMKRSGRFILIFYQGDKDKAAAYGEDDPFNNPEMQVKGSVELDTEKDKDEWLTLVSNLKK